MNLKYPCGKQQQHQFQLHEGRTLWGIFPKGSLVLGRGGSTENVCLGRACGIASPSYQQRRPKSGKGLSGLVWSACVAQSAWPARRARYGYTSTCDVNTCLPVKEPTRWSAKDQAELVHEQGSVPSHRGRLLKQLTGPITVNGFTVRRRRHANPPQTRSTGPRVSVAVHQVALQRAVSALKFLNCPLYPSDAAHDLTRSDLRCCRNLKKNNKKLH